MKRVSSTTSQRQRSASQISDSFIASACQRLKEGKPLRRPLSPWGRVHIDRQLPFLVVYRRPSQRDDPDTQSLVVGEASYLLASGAPEDHDGVSSLVQAIAGVLSESFGAFLIVEVWSSGIEIPPGNALQFRVLHSKKDRIGSTIEVLERALGEVKIKGGLAEVEVFAATGLSVPDLAPLITPKRASELACQIIGIEVPTAFRDLASGEVFPLVRRALHKGLSKAVQRAVFDFTRNQTSHRPPHYQALGRRSVVKAVWDVDRALAEVSNSFDFLLQVTPVNVDSAWSEFRRLRFERAPDFASRPLRLDPALVKRRLFAIPVEKIEDPTLEQLFRDQQIDLDRRLTMLGDRGTPQFLYGSLQLFGGVDASLLNTAYEILNGIPSRSRDESRRGAADAPTFAALASEELEAYRGSYRKLRSRVEVRKDLVGMMVSRGNLLVGASTKVPQSRVAALIAHEIGTHIVTYLNGRAQPFRQLYVGLPGYDELQEGIAVLSEYLVGGMSRPRLRLLAARVLAVHRMVEGATFVEVFRELDRAHDFAQRTAFTVTMRVFRGGGLTKDVAYLRGLVRVLAYLREGGTLEPLLVGKLGPAHIPIIQELQWRKVLSEPPLRPRWLDDPEAIERLGVLRKGLSPLDLVEHGRKS